MNETILKKIKSENVFNQLEYVEKILFNIPDLEITDDYRKELNRRVKEFEKNPSSGRLWKDVKHSPRN